MGSVADSCQKGGFLAATFFFSSFSGSPDRRLKRRLITTLAYQLQQHPSLAHNVGKRVLNAVGADPGLFDKALKDQMDELVLNPLRRCKGRYGTSGPLAPMVIIIDGLDECEVYQHHEPTQPKRKIPRTKEDDQEEILSILFEAIEDQVFPFRVIIASRPERHIRRVFSGKSTHSNRGIARELFLDEKYNPDADITLFFQSKFAQIRRQHDHLPPTWPGDDVIALLVKNASGQFVYAATVIGFVQTPSSPPQDIASPTGANARLYSTLASTRRLRQTPDSLPPKSLPCHQIPLREASQSSICVRAPSRPRVLVMPQERHINYQMYL